MTTAHCDLRKKSTNFYFPSWHCQYVPYLLHIVASAGFVKDIAGFFLNWWFFFGRNRQLDYYSQEPDLLIATPGRLNDFLQSGEVSVRYSSCYVTNDTCQLPVHSFTCCCDQWCRYESARLGSEPGVWYVFRSFADLRHHPAFIVPDPVDLSGS